jgi:hypothetical protein
MRFPINLLKRGKHWRKRITMVVSHTSLKTVSGPSSVLSKSSKSSKSNRKSIIPRIKINLSSMFNVTHALHLCSQLLVVLIVVAWSQYKHKTLEKKILLLSNRLDKQGEDINALKSFILRNKYKNPTPLRSKPKTPTPASPLKPITLNLNSRVLHVRQKPTLEKPYSTPVKSVSTPVKSVSTPVIVEDVPPDDESVPQELDFLIQAELQELKPVYNVDTKNQQNEVEKSVGDID